MRLGELLGEAGLPDGVFSIVNGAREAVDAILEHPGIKAVLLSREPAWPSVYKHGTAHKKRVQALAGAKNSMIAMPDAVLDKAVPNIISSAYGNAGERCSPGASSLAVGSEQQQDRLVEAVREAACDGGRWAWLRGRRAHPRDPRFPPPEGAPYVDLGEEEGAKVVLDGREPPREEGFLSGPPSSIT